jgi:hypothetical protein
VGFEPTIDELRQDDGHLMTPLISGANCTKIWSPSPYRSRPRPLVVRHDEASS